MAENSEQPSQSALASTFPNPPLFWKQFTADNLQRVKQLRIAQAEKEGVPVSELPLRLPSLPEELRTLQPPAEPEEGTWKVLGGKYSLDDKLPTLEEGEIRRLAPTTTEERDEKHLDRAFELKRMAKSLLLNFLELMGTMSMAPEDAASKVNDLQTILMNIHHMLNEYRPHQARESAIALMQSHLDRTRAETAAIRAQVDKAKRVLEGLGSLEIPDIPKSPIKEGWDDASDHEANELQSLREKEVWVSADSLFL